MQVRLFLSDVDDAGGALAIVPHPPTLGADKLDARQATELYKNEQLVRYRPGVAVLYRADSWHRGTPVMAGRLRRTHGLVYRRGDRPWVQAGGQVRGLVVHS